MTGSKESACVSPLARFRPIAIALALFGLVTAVIPAQTPPPAPPPQQPAPPAAQPPAAPAAPGEAPSTAPLPSTGETKVVVTAPIVTTKEQMEQVFDDFAKVPLDLEKPLGVHGLVLKRDTMELTLADGTIYLAKPIVGRTTGAYFTGHGSIKVTLPNAYDRKLMQGSIYGKPVFEEAIGEAVLRFDDGAEKEILAAAKPAPAASVDPSATWSDRQKIDAYGADLQVDFLENVLNGLKLTTFFSVDLHTADGKDWYNVEHNGKERVEDGIYHERILGSAGKRWYEVVSRFHRPEDYDPKGNYDVMPESDTKDLAALRNVTMTLDIANTKSLVIDAHLTVEALREGVRGIRFDFLNNLEGATWEDTKMRPLTETLVADGSGNPLPYVHRWHELVVLLPKPLPKGQSTVIEVKATEDTIIQLTDHSYSIYSSFPWFPKIGFEGGRYTMDWTMKTAKPLKATGTGDLVREWQEGDMNCAEWKSDVPVQLASFILGDFKVSDGEYKREPPGTGTVKLRLWTIQGGSEHFKGNAQNVLYNISEGLKRYESIYGLFPFKELDVAEMAHNLNFAQSPAGVLLVSTVTVGGTMAEDEEGNEHVVNIEEQGGLGKTGGGGTGDQFVFHELAHQWWGHQVGPISDEDDWISESWAEYSMGLVIDAIDAKRFALLRDRQWKHYAELADPFGTLSTAYRSTNVEHPREYIWLVYCKGPYVVHMLRTWMGWDKFSKLVSTIQTKYKGTNINTDTLAREASTVMGYDMFPFFDQWVRDKGIPRVHWSWSSAPDTDGKPIVTIRTKQEDQANYKIMMVPIAFDFGKGEPTVVLKPILKPEAEIKIKVPVAPKTVKMDPDSTQLANFVADGK